ncbi:MAG: M14-type cytosolic carboxypeptidase [Prosthecobacter sp.]|uniref:M14-type cytosolic carboxypeptidase n=1 Tax=Prosthecobacter sp. TaxID=1965333 RepID=UPI003902B207
MHSSLLLFLLTLTAHAELRVLSGFEGGNAEVVKLDQVTRTLRIMPALHEGRGWPCWWSFKLDGITVGEEFTLEVQAQTKPYREKAVLAAAWCQPKHAWISVDGQTWTPSAKGTLSADKVMSYTIKAAATQMSLAWGPPFVPSDADKLLADIAAKLPEAKRFELAKTRGGRAVQGIRIGAENAAHQVWIGSRQHAWEAGGSQVGRGFITWYASNGAKELRAKTCLHYIPIMDVDNAAIGAGGKEATPRDHNRDWAAEPIYPEVAAAQRMIRDIHAKHGLDVFIDLHNPGSDDPIFFFGPFAFERMTGIQQRNYQRWIDLAAASIIEPLNVQPKYRFATYVTSEEERGRMSSGWVRANTGDATISVTLETGWNSSLMSVEGYGKVGAGLGRTLATYIQENPRRE